MTWNLARCGAAAALLLAGCAADSGAPQPAPQAPTAATAAAPVGEPVPGAEMQALTRGNSMRGTTPAGASFTIHVRPDGTQRIHLVSRGTVMTDSGRVFLVDGATCNVWNTLRNGQRQCPEVRREGETFRSYEGGTLLSTFTIVPGNPDRL